MNKNLPGILQIDRLVPTVSICNPTQLQTSIILHILNKTSSHSIPILQPLTSLLPLSPFISLTFRLFLKSNQSLNAPYSWLLQKPIGLLN